MPIFITQYLWPARFIDRVSRNIISICLKEFHKKSLKPAPNTEPKNDPIRELLYAGRFRGPEPCHPGTRDGHNFCQKKSLRDLSDPHRMAGMT